ncbi:MAG: DegT/DnrJ/EryC1/StrS family aminotransferase [Verrucomicrobiota bacterium]|jgi:UDP-2-acetamido-2-deoxy-ribo-hexuluronate aminotransferase|nr:DegT/DnrJ/EryC1/StrS family aminotransferase [Verrucomicrobiota bacterium]
MEFIDLKTRLERIREKVDQRVAAVLDHGQFILGPEVYELEQTLASYVGTKYCVGVSSGTDSLLIALMALEVGSGDEVITVPYTWISTAEVIALTGARPVFVDIDPETWNMDPNLLEDAITENTKAIMPVGIYGQTADMDSINQIANRHNLPVIEDAAQSFGATYHGRKSCALSTIGSTSFFPSKPLGGFGDSGALFTDDDELAEKFRWIRVHGQERKHRHPILGVNGRLDTIQAAALLAIFEIFPEEVEQRQAIGSQYNSLLSKIDEPNIELPHVAEQSTSVYAQYTILSEDRNNIQDRLKSSNIPSVAYYAVPLHLQPVFAGLNHKYGDFPVTEKVADQCLSLPMSACLRVEDQQAVVEAIQS